MAARRRAPSRQTARRADYGRPVSQSIQGNTVRKLEPARRPDEDPKRHEPARRRSGQGQRLNQRIRRNQEKALYMDLPYVIILTAAAICTLYLCVNYLHIQSSITGRMHHIEELEQDLERLKAENDALETSINTSIDLKEIYRIATQELGMVYAKKDQVLLYDEIESEYVRQYEDIPQY